MRIAVTTVVLFLFGKKHYQYIAMDSIAPPAAREQLGSLQNDIFLFYEILNENTP
jgi:hypothetical protein